MTTDCTHRRVTTYVFVDGNAPAGLWACADCGRKFEPVTGEIERLRADRDCEKRQRKDSDDLATDLRLALEAVIADPADTGLAWAVLQRIHGA